MSASSRRQRSDCPAACACVSLSTTHGSTGSATAGFKEDGDSALAFEGDDGDGDLLVDANDRCGDDDPFLGPGLFGLVGRRRPPPPPLLYENLDCFFVLRADDGEDGDCTRCFERERERELERDRLCSSSAPPCSIHFKTCVNCSMIVCSNPAGKGKGRLACSTKPAIACHSSPLAEAGRFDPPPAPVGPPALTDHRRP